ncbi:MAG: hypothetical protein V3V08_20970 [Nannocystaceae bacterium]
MTRVPGPFQTPRTATQARDRLRRATIPPEVLEVGRTLHDAGHESVLVGGAVRDCLRGAPHDDWDLATSARPEEVVGLFRRTIPTGIAHGTVTVMTGRGERRLAVEVTTFRGDGEYVDGRRPRSVRFLRDLGQDLARRDFTINAFAWDPFTERFTDGFGGLADLRDGLVRAVGDPTERFREDGLRAMRAVRFCAVMEFSLDPATCSAITEALGVLDKVSRERIRTELMKLLGARRPGYGLRPLAGTGLWSRVLMRLEEEQREAAIQHIDALRSDAVLRLARLLWPRRRDATELLSVVVALKLSRADQRRVTELTRPYIAALAEVGEPAELRRIVARLGAGQLPDALDVAEVGAAQRMVIAEACDGSALNAKDLAIGARDLIDRAGAEAGPRLGQTLRTLLAEVIEDPRRNTARYLLKRGQELIARSTD